MLKKFLGDSGIARKDFFIVFILLFNAFTWWYILPIIIEDMLGIINVTHTQTSIIWTSYFAAIIGSSLVGSIFSNKIGRLNFFYLWIILGTVASLLPALFNSFTVTHVLIISISLGVSFGLGMPSCLAFFADSTVVENRGRVSGVILLIINLSAPLLMIPFGIFSLAVNSIIFAIWRGTGLLIFFLRPATNSASTTRKNVSFASIFRDKYFFLYFAAWFMFCLVDRFVTPIIRDFSGDFSILIPMIGPIIGSLFALIGGLLSDLVGRKRVVLYGFATLGIAYAIIGVAPTHFLSWYFYLAVGSISTGMLWVAFLLILWGDLPHSGTSEKYYAIGEAPFFLTSIMQYFFAQYFALIPATSTFSLAAFFLFIAVLPLLYAPETLPEKKIELRRLKEYVEGARKIKEKYAEKIA